MSGLAGILGTPREWARDLAIATAIGVFLGVIGPFGSFYGGPLEARLFYWVAILWVGFILLSLSARLSLRLASGLEVPDWFALPLGVALGAMPLTLIASELSARFWPGFHSQRAPFLGLYGEALAISEPCAFLFYFVLDGRMRRAVRRLPTNAATATGAPKEEFLDRLPARLGRNLLCLCMEDHYVRAHTDLGSDLILLPLKAAVAELAGVEGAQVHRSWWVARDAIAAPIARGRNQFLRLANGLEVPVSRGQVAKIRSMGWL